MSVLPFLFGQTWKYIRQSCISLDHTFKRMIKEGFVRFEGRPWYHKSVKTVDNKGQVDKQSVAFKGYGQIHKLSKT